MTKLRLWNMGGGVVFLVCAATAIAAQGQTFTTIDRFDGRNGALPFYSSLTQGVDGAFYGTTALGGNSGDGTAFRTTSAGTIRTAAMTGNSAPESGMVLATNQGFYGTSADGGTYGHGSVFTITPPRALTTLYSFCATGLPCADGEAPNFGLVEGIDGNYYGTTAIGGTESDLCPNGCGTIFKITPAGTLVTLYRFCSVGACLDGAIPYASLVLGIDGSFYGTTETGGNSSECEEVGCGTVFKITPTGSLITLYRFGGGADGYLPSAGLIQASDGNFYGTTHSGGANFGEGTVFRITPEGLLKTLYTFCASGSCADGGYPTAALVQGTDGDLYGSTTFGGGTDFGTIFKITTQEVLTTLHSFGNTDGANPESALVQATTGRFYGVTQDGGNLDCNSPTGCGTVFALDMGLGPFAAFVRPFGKIDQTSGILGQGYSGTTSVSFNGVPAQFEVRADTFLTATVPEGATTGYVTVTTPTGVLKSNVPFRVIQ